MSITSGTSYRFLFGQCIKGDHDIELDELRFAMFTTLAEIDPVTVDDYSSIGNELVGAGYTAGGQVLTQTVLYTPSNIPNDPDALRPAVDFEDLVFGPGATWGVDDPDGAAAGAVIYNATAGPQFDKVLWIVDFGSPQTVDNGTFIIQFPEPSNPANVFVRTTS